MEPTNEIHFDYQSIHGLDANAPVGSSGFNVPFCSISLIITKIELTYNELDTRNKDFIIMSKITNPKSWSSIDYNLYYLTYPIK